MQYIKFVKKYTFLPLLFISCSLEADTLGLLGGKDTLGSQPAYAATLSNTLQVTSLTGLPSTGEIESVAINSSGLGLIGGINESGFFSYAASVSATGEVLNLTLGAPIPGSFISSVAINQAGIGIIGQSYIGSGPLYAALVSPAGQVTPLPLPASNGSIIAVALNDSNLILLGGRSAAGAAIAAFITPQFQSVPLFPGLPNGIINDVALNNSGLGLIGGFNIATSAPYAAFVSSLPQVTPLPLGVNGQIFSVAINSSGQGLIGGQNISAPYAALATFPNQVTPLSLVGFATANGIIGSTSINSLSQGLIGGGESFSGTGPAYAALVSPSGQVTPLNIDVPKGFINDVVVNEFGQGLIGGFKGAAPYAALVDFTGLVIPLNLGFSKGFINTVALLSVIPTSGLSGNSRAFANYINENAPYDIFYFIPANFDGTLAQALESAAPTRNAFSIFTADNNMFYIDSLLSNHCRNTRHIRQLEAKKSSQVASALDIPSEELLAWSSRNVKAPPPVKEHPYEVWGTLLGALAYQKKQHQTPAFNPTTGGIILGFDGKTSRNGRVGTGAAYTYTYIHEKQNAGHSRINQEYLFVYTMWDNSRWYVDTALMAGFFQIDNVRKIHMTAFEFESKSHPKGWQLAPHFEFGYDFNSNSRKLTTEPFVMLDWVSNWQGHYKEHGSGPFNAGQKRHYSSFLRSETGVRVYETFLYDNWNFILEEKVSYVNKKPFKVGRVNAFLVGAPGSFTVETLTTTQNLGVAELEFIFQPHKKRYPTTTLAYQGEFGSMYQSHLMSLELSWNF